MLKKNISYMLIVSGILLSCNDEATIDAVPVQLQGSISQSAEGDTRAATTLYDTFYGGEQIDVSIYNGNTVDANKVIGKENIVYTIAADGKMTPPTDMQPYFPVTANGDVTIRASYPTSNSGTTSVTVAADQTSDDAYKQAELLWATLDATRTTGENVLQLVFHHRMSKIIVNLTSRNGVPELPTTVKLLQFKPTATLTKSTGVVAESGEAIDIVMTTNGAAMVPPQTIAANTPIFEIVTAQGDIAQYSSPTALVFKPDYVYTYDVQVDMRKIIVTTTITSWGTPSAENTFSGDVIGEEWS
ncbi:MAG: fimbrillin family protein [Prevotella sp.]|nr:fimbrillin family protein [Prevotella sp.]